MRNGNANFGKLLCVVKPPHNASSTFGVAVGLLRGVDGPSSQVGVGPMAVIWTLALGNVPSDGDEDDRM